MPDRRSATRSRAPTSSCTRARAATSIPCTTTRSRRSRPACRPCSATACSPPASSRRRSPNYVGIGNLKSYRVRFTKQTWPGEVLDHERHGPREAAPAPRSCSTARSRTSRARPRSGRSRRGAPVTHGTAVRSADARPRDPAVLGRAEGRQVPPPALQRLRRDHYYPRPFCPTCWSDDVAWKEASGAARCTRIRSCT